MRASFRGKGLHLQRFVVAATCILLVTGACGGGSYAPPGDQGPLGRDYDLSLSSVHYGASASEWAMRWVQWTAEIPLADHPLFDTTGEKAAVGQVDPVWFLGGVFAEWGSESTGTAERWITIPKDTALFFPIINAWADNVGCLPEGWEDVSSTEMRYLAWEIVNYVADVYCELDGDRFLEAADLAGAADYRAAASDFSAWMPEVNLYDGLCNEHWGAMVINPIAVDGIWVMLAPLPPGEHLLKFGGVFPEFGYFKIDITYHIQVEE